MAGDRKATIAITRATLAMSLLVVVTAVVALKVGFESRLTVMSGSFRRGPPAPHAYVDESAR
jgi:hypothetical protein